MWLAGEVFPRAWKLLGYSMYGLACFRGCPAVLLVGSLFAIAWEVGWFWAMLCGCLNCIMHGGCSSPLRHFRTRA
jgi:hypothetical protein